MTALAADQPSRPQGRQSLVCHGGHDGDRLSDPVGVGAVDRRAGVLSGRASGWTIGELSEAGSSRLLTVHLRAGVATPCVPVRRRAVRQLAERLALVGRLRSVYGVKSHPDPVGVGGAALREPLVLLRAGGGRLSWRVGLDERDEGVDRVRRIRRPAPEPRSGRSERRSSPLEGGAAVTPPDGPVLGGAAHDAGAGSRKTPTEKRSQRTADARASAGTAFLKAGLSSSPMRGGTAPARGDGQRGE